jgi:hypothetical protein
MGESANWVLHPPVEVKPSYGSIYIAIEIYLRKTYNSSVFILIDGMDGFTD